MFLAKVKGNLVSTKKNNYLKNYKLLLTHPVDCKGNFIGNNDFVTLDNIDAGVNDIVIVVQEGDAVQQILGHKNSPVNTMIIAIVDNLEIYE
jgi:ethanolamine utilization protein EutN